MIKSKSTDWTDAELEVPEKDEAIQLKNPQLSFIFNDNTTPTPPPRKHKKSIREKIETVAKNGMQALQSKKPNDETKKLENESKKPCEEQICVKKVINYGCPCGDREHCQHKAEKREATKNNQKKEAKRKKNLSVVSLPNYNELKFSIANSENSNLKYIDSSVSNSANSLPGETKKAAASVPAGKLENYMTRCRSFGSLLNNKLRISKEPTDIESDDSFGGLEDWDLGILEHYNPKDASLPRPRKPISEGNVLSDIEKLIVQEEDIAPPVRPVRRSESLIKKMNREGAEASIKRSTEILNNEVTGRTSITPPPSPRSQVEEDVVPLISSKNLPSQDEDGNVEHSSLMRILQEFSIKDAQKRNSNEEYQVQNHVSPTILSPCNKQQVFLNEKSISNVTKDFINAEKVCVS